MKLRTVLMGFAVAAAAWAVVDAAPQLKVLPGSSVRGQRLIVEKGCLDCHRLDRWGSDRAPDLTRTPPNARRPSMLAVAMWNHAPDMWWDSGVNRKGLLTSGDSADLFAYFYSALYFALPGDPAVGRTTFEQNHCADCHSEKPTAGGIGPAISTWSPVDDPVDWSQRMWNHSSAMLSTMLPRGIEWPSLSTQNIADLMVYFMTVAPRSPVATFSIGEPEQGQMVFEQSCQSCHSFGPGDGNTIDLRARPAPVTVTSYIAAMWNHAPLMRARNRSALPALKPGEMSDLIAFLFSRRYFFEQGDADSGRRVYDRQAELTNLEKD